MNVSLNPHFDEFIQNQLASGRYSSASEVIRDGLRLLEKEQQIYDEKLSALRHDLQKASESLKNGEGISGEESLARLRRLIDDVEKQRA